MSYPDIMFFAYPRLLYALFLDHIYSMGTGIGGSMLIFRISSRIPISILLLKTYKAPGKRGTDTQ